MIVVFLMLSIAVVATHSPDWRAAFDFAVVVPLAFAAPCLLGLRWRWHKQFQRKFSANVNSTAIIDENGVTLTGHKAHLWGGFTGIYDSSRVVLMEEGGDDFIFLPKSAMSGAQLLELKRLAIAMLDCPVTLAPPLA